MRACVCVGVMPPVMSLSPLRVSPKGRFYALTERNQPLSGGKLQLRNAGSVIKVRARMKNDYDEWEDHPVDSTGVTQQDGPRFPYSPWFGISVVSNWRWKFPLDVRMRVNCVHSTCDFSTLYFQ